MQRNWTCGSPNVSVLGGELIRYNEMNTLSIHYSIRHEKIEPNSTLACLQFLIDTYCPPPKKIFIIQRKKTLKRESWDIIQFYFCSQFCINNVLWMFSFNISGPHSLSESHRSLSDSQLAVFSAKFRWLWLSLSLSWF